MNLYLVQAIEDGVTLATRYAGSNIDARNTRKALANEFNVQKDRVIVESVEVSTKKVDLLETLNELCALADYVGPENQALEG